MNGSFNHWTSHPHPSNPYPHHLPPPPIPHKVWILDCKSCGAFLTNRGMKAVLLLRPNVSLYSSDALPVNCSAFTSNPDVLRPPTSCRPQIPPRTCECLTQTLCCQGCGSTIGYMIVIPCARCTTSISATNRATNGHRFVFHSSEIVSSERHYVQDESGVFPFEPAAVISSFVRPDMHSMPNPGHFIHPAHPRPDYYLPTPPIDPSDLSPISSNSPSPVNGAFPFSPQPFTPPTDNGYSPSISASSSTLSSIDYDDSPPPLVPSYYAFGVPVEQVEMPPPRMLQAGDVLYWHNLSRHGEIPGVCDDARARRADTSQIARKNDPLFGR